MNKRIIKTAAAALAVFALCCAVSGCGIIDLMAKIAGDDGSYAVIYHEDAEPPAETSAADVTAPVISGVKNIICHQDDTVSYREGVTVTDDTDAEPELAIDASEVDLAQVGKYIVVYTASDSAGNISQVRASVTVVAKEAVTLEQGNSLADKIIDNIIKPGADDKEKILAVHDFVYSIGFADANYGGIDDYLENAWYYYYKRVGDCRCSYALSKLLLERLGYKTMKIRNTENTVYTHYWMLVSTDGENWYHFDATDQSWNDAPPVCMVTDEWLKAYYKEHKVPGWNWYEWDESAYPATPAEEFR